MAKVCIYLDDGVTLEYEGDVEVGMNPANALVVHEKVPNVTGTKEPHLSKVRALINPSAWLHAEVE